jgi:hypothetical protein
MIAVHGHTSFSKTWACWLAVSRLQKLTLGMSEWLCLVVTIQHLAVAD